MTLDLRKYLENLISKEAVVSHFKVSVKAGKAKKIKPDVASQIRATYGDLFLEDADYVLFFTRQEQWTDKDVKKLFELTDRALGKDANKLSKNDFMKLSSAKSAAPAPSDDLDDDLDDEESNAAPVQDDSSSNALFVKITIK